MKTQVTCLCKAVSIDIELTHNVTAISACHCKMCRTWSGGPMLALESAVLKNISNAAAITRYASSDWAERGFCKQCGTSLFYYLKPADQYHFPVGLLDDTLAFRLTQQIFIDEKPSYYSFANNTQTLTGEEVFAHFESKP